jgi:N-acetyl-anhydromuramyl-L-alanine amidase AmpD
MKRAHIIVCGVEVEVPGDVKVVTFRDNPRWSFMAARLINRESRFLYPRFDKDGREVRDLTKLKDVVNKIVLHSDVTKDAAACFRVLVQEGYSTHFCVDWDGTIYQTADPQYTAIHAGPANKTSIGIDMNNALPNLARKGYSSVTYPTDIHPGIQDPDSPLFRPKSKRMQINSIMTQSYGYADKQYESLMALLKALLKVVPTIKPFPPVDESGKIIPRVIDDFLGFSGIMAHWHISSTRWDPGPGFDWDRLVAGLSEEHNSFPFLLPDRKNIATLMARSKVEKRAMRYYGNNEQGSGGYFPIGLYQNWHNGIHLHPPEGADVLNMMDGMLVAAHFDARPTLLGSNNFVLLRHDAKLPTISSSGKASRKTLKTYSLYMHLAPMSLEPTKDAPPWLRALYRGDIDEDDDAQPDLADGKDGEDEDDQD